MLLDVSPVKILCIPKLGRLISVIRIKDKPIDLFFFLLLLKENKW